MSQQSNSVEKEVVADPNDWWCPDVCPITGLPFFMWITHHETGKWVPTYGGPYYSHTIPVKDKDGCYIRERYDHDLGGWLVDQVEDVGVQIVDDQLYTSEDDPSEMLARIAALEATNAAQAEQLAEADGQIEWLDRENNRITAEYYERMQRLDRNWQQRMDEVLDPVFQAKMLQPPAPIILQLPQAEPQAGVELTDEEIKAAFIEAHGGDAAYYDSHGYEIRWTTRTVQRQAVKAEPAIEALAMIGEVLGLDEDDAGPTPIIEKIVCLQEAFETVKRLQLIATNQVVDLRKAAKPEQAQTAVGLPGTYAADIVASSILTYLGFAQEVSMEPGADDRRDKLAEGIESYATAKTAEAVRELVDGMRYMRQEFAGLPHSLGYDFTHLPKIDAILAKHEPKKEQ